MYISRLRRRQDAHEPVLRASLATSFTGIESCDLLERLGYAHFQHFRGSVGIGVGTGLGLGHDRIDHAQLETVSRVRQKRRRPSEPRPHRARGSRHTLGEITE